MAGLHKQALGIVALGLFASSAEPQTAPAGASTYSEDWLRNLGGIGGRGVGIDSQGNVYATGAGLNLPSNGYRHDILTMKYAPDGTLLWQNTYNNEDDPTNQDDDPAWLTMDGQDNVIVVGTTHTNATGKVGVTLKYDSDGNLLWERLHGVFGVVANEVRRRADDRLRVEARASIDEGQRRDASSWRAVSRRRPSAS
jgi:hypothetical protein